MGLVKAGHMGKGSVWESGVSRLELGVEVEINIGTFIWVSQVGMLIGFDFKDLPDNLICGLMVSSG
jgi:hypothetical protein